MKKLVAFLVIMLITSLLISACSKGEYTQEQDDESKALSAVQENTTGDKEGLVFKMSHGAAEYNITVDCPYTADKAVGDKENYYRFAFSDDYDFIRSIELTALYSCEEDDIRNQIDNLILNYQSSSTILYSESFSYGNNNLLTAYVVHGKETLMYYQICYLYDAENDMLCEYVLELGDLENFRRINSTSVVKDFFNNVSITKDPYAKID